MAVVIQVIDNGPRRYVIKVDIAASANADTEIVPASVLASGDNLSLNRAQWSFANTAANPQGEVVALEWEATADVVLLNIVTGESGELCFEQGIPNNAGAGKTGAVSVTNSITVTGTMLLEFKKN
jgi:hypothetical protein